MPKGPCAKPTGAPKGPANNAKSTLPGFESVASAVVFARRLRDSATVTYPRLLDLPLGHPDSSVCARAPRRKAEPPRLADAHSSGFARSAIASAGLPGTPPTPSQGVRCSGRFPYNPEFASTKHSVMLERAYSIAITAITSSFFVAKEMAAISPSVTNQFMDP